MTNIEHGQVLVDDDVSNSIDVNEASAHNLLLQCFTLELYTEAFDNDQFLSHNFWPHEFLAEDGHQSETENEYKVIIREHAGLFNWRRCLLLKVLSMLYISLQDSSQSIDHLLFILTQFIYDSVSIEHCKSETVNRGDYLDQVQKLVDNSGKLYIGSFNS